MIGQNIAGTDKIRRWKNWRFKSDEQRGLQGKNSNRCMKRKVWNTLILAFMHTLSLFTDHPVGHTDIMWRRIYAAAQYYCVQVTHSDIQLCAKLAIIIFVRAFVFHLSGVCRYEWNELPLAHLQCENNSDDTHNVYLSADL